MRPDLDAACRADLPFDPRKSQVFRVHADGFEGRLPKTGEFLLEQCGRLLTALFGLVAHPVGKSLGQKHAAPRELSTLQAAGAVFEANSQVPNE